ncbi:MAG TPA: hypothetical protein VK674_02555 [Candidatus Limnocylindria bacterium]|nr:hypothetical protein [Candidatus Limnocylindria bacterium]
MIVFFHVLTALASLVVAGVAFFSPSQAKLRLTYVLTAGMLASGVYLVVQNSSHLLKACVMGLVYLVVVSFEIAAARHKLAKAPVG